MYHNSTYLSWCLRQMVSLKYIHIYLRLLYTCGERVYRVVSYVILLFSS